MNRNYITHNKIDSPNLKSHNVPFHCKYCRILKAMTKLWELKSITVLHAKIGGAITFLACLECPVAGYAKVYSGALLGL
jgi:hypothetical protein